MTHTQLKKYGLILQRLTKEDIELVRHWRNQPHIRNNMADKRYISESDQVKWFNSINNPVNYYFIIIYSGIKVGIVNVKNVDNKNMIGEGGIFIWEQTLWDTPIPVMASLILLETIFEYFESGNKSIIRIMKDNKRAIHYNTLMGYVLLPYQDNVKYQFYILTKDDYMRVAPRLKRAAQLYSGDFSELCVVGHKNPLNLPIINAKLPD